MIIDRRRASAVPPARRGLRLETWLGCLSAAAAAAAWLFYLQQDAVLSHYDAKAHLVVARRVIDNITPGWQQIGAVWLPLPHLIQVLPVQVDLLYRTGAFGSLVSIASFGVTVWAAARLILHVSASRLAAGTAAAILVLNPNLLYLSATPMTEPLLAACSLVSVLWLYEWTQADRDDVPGRLGWLLFATAWTRYEAWPLLAAALAAVSLVHWLRGAAVPSIGLRLWRLARWPAAAVALFLLNSRATVGAWFVSSGFFEPDPMYAGEAWRSLLAIWWGTHQLSGYVVEIVALGVAGVALVQALTRRADPARLIPAALFAAALLPFAAFHDGHPFRIRYMVPMVVACAVWAGLAVGAAASAARSGAAPARARSLLPGLAAALLLGSTLIESPPWMEHPPLVSEALWDVPMSLNRRAVTACLDGYAGEKIAASMGSLAHYMQELSWSGLDLSDFVHEGTGGIWTEMLATRPALHAGWMLVEEQSEGGDVLARRIRDDPQFTGGMRRVCEGGGVALYRRDRA